MITKRKGHDYAVFSQLVHLVQAIQIPRISIRVEGEASEVLDGLMLYGWLNERERQAQNRGFFIALGRLGKRSSLRSEWIIRV